MSIIHVTSREFRDKQARLFDLADSGEKVIINRGKKRAYALIPLEKNDFIVSPELNHKIEKARQEYKDGETLHFENASDAQKWMNEL